MRPIVDGCICQACAGRGVECEYGAEPGEEECSYCKRDMHTYAEREVADERYRERDLGGRGDRVDPVREARAALLRVEHLTPAEWNAGEGAADIETIRAALAAPPSPAPGLPLDAAWAEVEKALPVVPEQVHPSPRWRIEGLHLVDTSDDEDLSVEQLEWEAEATRGGWPHQPFNVTGYGPTPVAALQALAARLAADAATDEAEGSLPLNRQNGPWCGCGQPLGHAVPNVDCDPAPWLDAVYAERNRLVAALAHLFGNAAWRGLDPGAPGFTIVYIDLPSGQVSWHIPDAEMAAFPPLPLRDPPGWDGHDNDEKYRRLGALRRGDICRDVQEAVARALAARHDA